VTETGPNLSGCTDSIPDTPASTWSTIGLWICGFAIAAISAAFAWRYPLPGNTERLTDIGKLARYGKPEFAGFSAGIGGMFIFYVFGIWATTKLSARRALLPVFTCGLAQVTAMAFLYPVSAIDVFIYAVRSRLFTEYGDNPLVVYPRAYYFDNYMHFASPEWADNLSPYGPLWNLIAAPATLIGGDSIGFALALFKLLAILSALLGAALIYLALRRTRPETAATGALIFLWNPLVLWEGIGNAHNDLVLMVFVLAALYAWNARHDEFVIPLLVAGAMIKYMPLLIIPLAGIAVLRRAPTWVERASVAFWSALGSGVAVAVGFFPFYDIQAVRKSIDSQTSFYITSLPAVAINQLHNRFQVEDIKHVTELIGRGAVALGLLAGIVLILVKPDRWPRVAFELTFVYLLLATPAMRNWYAIWLVGLVALLPLGWPTARAIAWSLGSLAVYGFFIWVWAWWRVDFDKINTVGVAIMLVPALVLTLGEIIAALIKIPPRRTSRQVSTVEAQA
jgi:alpha-1,6-mannosyltransferase